MRLKMLLVSIAAISSFGFGMVTDSRSLGPEGTIQYRPVNGLSELQARQSMVSNAVRIRQGLHGGSGVAIYDGLVLTAFHVVEEVNQATERFYDCSVELNGVTTYGWEVAYWDSIKDLAILNNPNTVVGRKRYHGVANSSDIGEKVLAAGFPILQGPYLTEGYISEIKSYDSTKVSCCGTSGSSGSGLYNLHGQLVGIIHKGYIGYDFMMLSVPLHDLRSFFNNVVKGNASSAY